MTRWLIPLLLFALPALADSPALFSTASGDALPIGWRVLAVPKIPAPTFSLATLEGTRVLRVEADKAAGTLAADVNVDPAVTPLLQWRWRIERSVAQANMNEKRGDDFAARVYVFFAVPLENLPFLDRVKIQLARTFYNAELPTAAICYVWDNKHAPGTNIWSPYTNRVRVVVVQSGDTKAGQWAEESRDLAADFQAAFGSAVPRVTGIALGADTDQTGERVVTHFGDVRFAPRP